VTSVARDALVEVDYRVRRRRYDDSSFLVRHLEYVEIDEITDGVWLACEHGGTVGDVINVVAERHQLPLGEAIAATVVILERLRALGFVTYGPRPVLADPASSQ
jgi:hypothetical protein